MDFPLVEFNMLMGAECFLSLAFHNTGGIAPIAYAISPMSQVPILTYVYVWYETGTEVSLATKK